MLWPTPLGHPIVERVVRQRHARDDDHSPAVLGAHGTRAVDRDRTRRRALVAEKLALLRRSRHGGTMTRLAEKADRFVMGPHPGRTWASDYAGLPSAMSGGLGAPCQAARSE
jgi:hypothetical protein